MKSSVMKTLGQLVMSLNNGNAFLMVLFVKTGFRMHH